MSDTPRTDAVHKAPGTLLKAYDAMWRLASDLERELREAVDPYARDKRLLLLARIEELERERNCSVVIAAEDEMLAVWNMLLLDGNCSDPTLTGASKLRHILDDLIDLRAEVLDLYRERTPKQPEQP